MLIRSVLVTFDVLFCTFLTASSSTYEVPEGGTVTLECPQMQPELSLDFSNHSAGKDPSLPHQALWTSKKDDKSIIFVDKNTWPNVARYGIFTSEQFELLRNGTLKITSASPDLTGVYTCSVQSAVLTSPGEVCLDVLREGYKLLCANQKPTKPTAASPVLETKYVAVIAALGGGLVILVLIGFLIRTCYKRKIRFRTKEQPNPSYGHHSDAQQSSRYCADMAQVKSINQNMFGIKQNHCRGPLPEVPKNQTNEDSYRAVSKHNDSGVCLELDNYQGASPTQSTSQEKEARYLIITG